MTEQTNKYPVVHTVVTVNDLTKSKMFYKLLFEIEPKVDSENFVEIKLNENFILGLQNIKMNEKLFNRDLISKFKLNKTSSAEFYIECKNPEEMHQKALQFGCLELSPFRERDWGQSVAYSVNHDGHVLAFAKS
jgi:predicted lactoylglutathione lyase